MINICCSLLSCKLADSTNTHFQSFNKALVLFRDRRNTGWSLSQQVSVTLSPIQRDSNSMTASLLSTNYWLCKPQRLSGSVHSNDYVSVTISLLLPPKESKACISGAFRGKYVITLGARVCEGCMHFYRHIC